MICKHKNRGFTLIEVMIALSIIGIASTVFFNVFSDSFLRIHNTEMDVRAQSLAQSLIEQTGNEIALQTGDADGQYMGEFHWHLHIEPYGDQKDHEAWIMQAYQVAASISWDDEGKVKSVTLTTLRLIPKSI